MSLEEQLWTLNPYVIKRIPLYILSMPRQYFNELLQDTNIIVFERGMGKIVLERPIEVDGHTYTYMEWELFKHLLRKFRRDSGAKSFTIDELNREIFGERNIYNILSRKFNFNDKTIERFKYYMLLLFLSAWKRNPEWVDGSLVEAWKMDVMQDIVNENLKITPYGKDGIYNREKLYGKEDITRIILDANLNSGNVGVNSTTSRATYDTFISQKYRILSVKRNRILGNALIKVNMLVEPSMNMKYFWEDYNYIIPILFLSKEKKHFRLLNYTRELFDQIK
mgnify:CR=1 FL=1